MVTEPVNIDVDEWFWDWTPIDTIKVESSNNNPSKGIFIGLAGESDLQAYLADVDYDEITDFPFLGSDVDYENHPGGSVPAVPTSQTFWEVSAHEDINHAQADVIYDFVYVDMENFEQYNQASFRQLIGIFQEYKEKI